jgi:hemolysin activation/secretion protein
MLPSMIAMMASAALVLGRDVDGIMPTVLVRLPAMDPVSSAEPPRLPPGSAEPVVRRLNAIVLVSRPEMVRHTGEAPQIMGFNRRNAGDGGPLEPLAEGPASKRGNIRSVVLRDVTPPKPEAFSKEISARYIGKPVSPQTIDSLKRDIVLYYRRHDRPVVDVVLPEQEITSGVLQFVVIEGHVGEVRVEGNEWFSTQKLAGQLRMQSGQEIETSRVEADVNWLETNPFREVNATYAPGKDFGTTDVIFHVRDRVPFGAHAEFENGGNEVTGEDRWRTGFCWGNAFGLDQQLSYQFTASSDPQGLLAHSATYTIPLPWRHTLSLSGTYSDESAEPSETGQASRESGRSWSAGLRYTVPLPPIGSVAHDLFFGADFKRANNDFAFGGTQLYPSDVDIAQLAGGYEAEEQDRLGGTTLKGTIFYSPGGVTDDNSDEAFQQARAFSRAEYVFGRLNVERCITLPEGFSLRLKASGQWSSTNLQASEQLSLGGYDSVRGFQEYETRGDSGYLLSAELRTPSFSLLHLGQAEESTPALHPFDDQLQLLAFFDYGKAYIRDPVPGEASSIELASAGVGLRYAIARYLSVRFDYGWPLKDGGLPHSRDAATHLGVTISY